MLKKEHISNIQIYSPEWVQVRLGRITSSRVDCLLGEKSLTQGAMSYLYQKMGEDFTGVCTATGEDTIDDENTFWGKEYEPVALTKFGQVKGLEYLVTQKVIFDKKTKYSSTPDAIWIHGESINEQEYNVSTVEVKCPPTYNNFIPLMRCTTPASLKRFKSKYYWQVIDQMAICDSAVGYFMCFHPLFPEGANYRIIQFRKIDLWDDFKFLHIRKKQAIEEISRIRLEILSAGIETGNS